MKQEEFYRLSIQAGMDADPRGTAAVLRDLQGIKKTCDDLKPGDQAACDLEKLSNPNTDSRNLQGSPDREVRTILAGIDIETPELLLADRLNEKGAGIDRVLAHHLEGRAFANFYEVMKMQADILNR